METGREIPGKEEACSKFVFGSGFGSGVIRKGEQDLGARSIIKLKGGA